jgi:hypothetical protein
MGIRVIEFSEYDVVVPFVCHRCGNCCRNFYPGIAGLIGRPIHEIQARRRL